MKRMRHLTKDYYKDLDEYQKKKKKLLKQVLQDLSRTQPHLNESELAALAYERVRAALKSPTSAKERYETEYGSAADIDKAAE